MLETGTRHPQDAAAAAGLSGTGKVFWNLGAPHLTERAIARGEARLTASGALVVESAAGTPVPHLVVATDDEAAEGTLAQEAFARLRADMLAHAAGRTLFAQDLAAGSLPRRGKAVRLFAEQAWPALALRNLLTVPETAALERFIPALTLFCLPQFRPEAEAHGVAGPLVVEDGAAGLVLIAGTADIGVLERALFTALARRHASDGALALRGAASIGPSGEAALFLGAEGSGKTTLALDATLDAGLDRALLADGAMGWATEGLFNLEGGLASRARDVAGDPAVEAGVDRFGVVMSQVPLDADSRRPDFAAAPAQARVLLPLELFPDAAPHNAAAVAPRAVFLLCRDGFGVLPAMARLSPDQALYHLLSGYSAPPEAASPADGTKAVFAPGFGAFPAGSDHARAGRVFRELVARQDVECWLVNTGWTGGQAGRGTRVPLEATRRLVAAALDGTLARAEYRTDPVFGVGVPVEVEGIAPALLDPARAWVNRADLSLAARRLADLFAGNFARFGQEVEAELAEARPRLAVAAE